MRRIAVVGLPYFGTRVAATLIGAGYDARFVPSPRAGLVKNPLAAGQLLRADLVYSIGPNIERGGLLANVARAKRVLLHWVGSDVQHALEVQRRRQVSKRLRQATHWADAPWLIDELKPLRLRVEEHPLPMPIAFGRPEPMPEEPKVLVFLPEAPHAAYDVAGTIEVIDRLPEVQFLLVGGFQLARPNVENAGYQHDMAAVYRRASCFLRLVHHDGLAHTVVEALSFGRQVIWNYPLGGVTTVANVDEAVAAVRDHASGRPALNEAGLAASERYRPARVTAEAREALEALFA